MVQNSTWGVFCHSLPLSALYSFHVLQTNKKPPYNKDRKAVFKEYSNVNSAIKSVYDIQLRFTVWAQKLSDSVAGLDEMKRERERKTCFEVV